MLEYVCHELILVRICGTVNNCYVCRMNDDLKYECLLASMALKQEEYRKVVFVFSGDSNSHHSEWL